MRRHVNPLRGSLTAGSVLAAALAAASFGAEAARAGDSTTCPRSTDAPYSITQLRALTGPAGGDLAFRIVGTEECPVPAVLKKIQVKTFAADGTVATTENLTNVDAHEGAVDLALGQIPRDRRVEVDIQVQAGTPTRTYVVRGFTRTLLRPDLVVESVDADPQLLMTKPDAIAAVIAELNGDVGATATVTLETLLGPLATKEVSVAAAGKTEVVFSGFAFAVAVPTDVTIRVDQANPGETDATNNTATVRVDVTEHELPLESNVLFPSLMGYGAQFNHHLYAPITASRMPPDAYPNVEEKVEALQPQLVRIFYNDNWEENYNGDHPEWADNYASFVKVVQLAQETGATINITYQTLGNITRTDSRRRTPEAAMAKFADALQDLVTNQHLTNVRWATVGNEPNSGAVTLAQYNALYRALHAQLLARGLRDQIHLMGGDLVENAGNAARNHYVWMQWIAANMGDVVDAYSEHVYWNYNDTGRLEYRLRDTAHLMNEVLPPEQRKPTYMMEFGARGLGACGTKPAAANTYYAVDPTCPEIWRTNIAAFQQFWFAVDSAQLGVAGAAKWDAYWAVYDFTISPPQVYWMTGPASEGYPLLPTYDVMSLLFHVTVPGWQIIGVDPWNDDDRGVPIDSVTGLPRWGIEGHASADQPEKELVAYAGPNGELTVIGLDTRGRALNTAATEPAPAYSIGGLPPYTTFNLALWNATGNGTNSIGADVTTNALGVARFEVPLHAAFALTTVPVS
jgi:hypothetical protein